MWFGIFADQLTMPGDDPNSISNIDIQEARLGKGDFMAAPCADLHTAVFLSIRNTWTLLGFIVFVLKQIGKEVASDPGCTIHQRSTCVGVGLESVWKAHVGCRNVGLGGLCEILTAEKAEEADEANDTPEDLRLSQDPHANGRSTFLGRMIGPHILALSNQFIPVSLTDLLELLAIIRHLYQRELRPVHEHCGVSASTYPQRQCASIDAKGINIVSD